MQWGLWRDISIDSLCIIILTAISGPRTQRINETSILKINSQLKWTKGSCGHPALREGSDPSEPPQPYTQPWCSVPQGWRERGSQIPHLAPGSSHSSCWATAQRPAEQPLGLPRKTAPAAPQNGKGAKPALVNV